jgi:serine/threonine-protein kinase
MALTPGTRIGPYEIVAPIGAGGMGEVYRARDTKLNRDVALKILPEAFASDADRLARFTREAQTLAALNDPHIAQIYGLEGRDGQDGQEAVRALAMEFVDGEDLAQRLVRGPIPLDEALAIAKQIVEGLEAAHEQGIVHRDLKPANIKLTLDGVVKILDFGLAKAIDPTASSPAAAALTHSPTITTPAQMTMAGMILGTAAYMSPEQAKGRPVDKRADVWAFGCVLYEMLTGRKAFEGEDVSDTLAAVLRSEPDWSALPDGLPSAVRTLIERCLSKERRLRIADISVARFVFNGLLVIGDAKPQGSGTPVPVRRSRLKSSIGVAASVLVTATVVATGAWALRPSNAAAPVARFSFTLPEGQVLTQMNRPILAMAPDGTALVYVASNRLFLRSLSEFDARPLSGVEGVGATLGSPVFSPDGRSVAFYSGRDGAIRRVAAGGGAAVTICPTPNPYGITWDASGIVFGQFGKGIFRCSPNGGDPELLVTVKDDEVPFGPQILPGGAAVLFTLAKASDAVSNSDKAQVVVETLASHQRKTIVSAGTNARYLPTGHLLYALGGIVFAVAFDPAQQAIRSGPVPVIEGVRRAVTIAGAAHFATSDTGALAYLPGPVGAATVEWAIAVADRTGAVTRASLSPGPYVHVRVSHDGSRLAVGTDDGKEAIAWIYDLGGASALRRLTFGGQNRFPIWSPDGLRVAFQSTRDGDTAIFVQRVDGTGGVERLTKPEKGAAHFPESWSPDGRVILFSSTNGSGRALWTVSVSDKQAAPFGDVRSVEPIESVFSPDGRWIAYTQTPSANNGRSPDRGVFVQPFPATGARYQVPSQVLDFHPVWGTKGSELLYVPSAASGQLAVTSFSTKPSVTFGSPETLPARVTGNRLSGAARAWDVLPDGRMVGLVQPAEPDSSAAAAPQFRVVLNWFEELKARVPVK